MRFIDSSIGRKLVMSVSGFSMLGFVVVHLLGNSTIYAGPNGINAYAKALHTFPLLIWLFRLFLFAMLYMHVFYGLQLTIENRASRPQAYSVKKSLDSTFAGRNMLWTGLLIAAFIFYHLLQFTFQVTAPETSAARNLDAMGRPDVFTMVILNFRRLPISLTYVFAMGALALHLSHSIQSGFQTLGLNSDRTFPVIIKGGTLVAILIFLGYIAFPITIFARLVR
jgi:succinate dehydrogenase / fumarate reductase cytochrome b subunit